jgi:hypothetical protein
MMVPGESLESFEQFEDEHKQKQPMANAGKRKSLYDDDALITMQRQAKEAELPFYDNDENSHSNNQS